MIKKEKKKKGLQIWWRAAWSPWLPTIRDSVSNELPYYMEITSHFLSLLLPKDRDFFLLTSISWTLTEYIYIYIRILLIRKMVNQLAIILRAHWGLVWGEGRIKMFVSHNHFCNFLTRTIFKNKRWLFFFSPLIISIIYNVKKWHLFCKQIFDLFI